MNEEEIRELWTVLCLLILEVYGKSPENKLFRKAALIETVNKRGNFTEIFDNPEKDVVTKMLRKIIVDRYPEEGDKIE